MQKFWFFMNITEKLHKFNYGNLSLLFRTEYLWAHLNMGTSINEIRISVCMYVYVFPSNWQFPSNWRSLIVIDGINEALTPLQIMKYITLENTLYIRISNFQISDSHAPICWFFMVGKLASERNTGLLNYNVRSFSMTRLYYWSNRIM